MKESNFNIYLQKKNCVLCYNTFTDSYLAISVQAYNFFRENGIENFSKEFPSLYTRFVDLGFIIEEEFDELGTIRLNNKLKTFNSRDYFMMVYPTQDCNLKCWYCYENHIKDSFMSEDVQKSIVKHISVKIGRKEIDSLHLTFFGGEPFLNFDTIAYPLLEQIKTICDNASITLYTFFVTNGTLLSEDIILRLKNFHPMFQITIDGNREKHNKVRKYKSQSEGTFDLIIRSLNLISKNIISNNPNVLRNVTIRVNYDNRTLENIDDIIESIKDLDKNKFFIHLERVWQTKDKTDGHQNLLLKEAIRKLSSMGFRVGHGIFGKKAYSCPAEIFNYAIVNYDGLIYKCNGRNLIPEKAEGLLLSNGNIQWNNTYLIKRTSVATFENEKCLNCKMLPQCMGPCSQKQIEHGWGNVDEICSLDSLDISLDEYLTLDFETRYIIEQNYTY